MTLIVCLLLPVDQAAAQPSLTVQMPSRSAVLSIDNDVPLLVSVFSIDLLIAGVGLIAGGLSLEESAGMSNDVVALHVSGAIAFGGGIALGVLALGMWRHLRVDLQLLDGPIELELGPIDRGVRLRVRGRF